MGRGDTSCTAERATSSTEFVGICATVALLAVALSPGLATSGTHLASVVASSVHRAVAGQAPRSRPTGGPAPPAAPRVLQAAAGAGSTTRTERRGGSREHRRSGGPDPVRVRRDELQLTPLVDEVAVRSAAWQERRHGAHGDVAVSVRACAICTALEWRHELRPGAGIDKTGRRLGMEARLRGEGRASLLAVEATADAGLRAGPADVTASGRARAAIGAELEAEARARLGAREQDVELRAGALAGASVRAEARVGVELLGVAIRQSTRAEGWVGAGARGTIGVSRTASRLDWRFGWGAALGVGGATEWSGSIDVSDVPERHRRLARDALAIALRSSRLATPLPIRPFSH